MKTYEVLVRVEAYIQVRAECEEEAEIAAITIFDPTAYDAVAMESFEAEPEYDDEN